jgi:hypothetical protein
MSSPDSGEISEDENDIFPMITSSFMGKKRKQDSQDFQNSQDFQQYDPTNFENLVTHLDDEDELLLQPAKMASRIFNVPDNAYQSLKDAMFNPTDYGVTLNQSKPTITAIPQLQKNSFLSQPTQIPRQIIYEQLMSELNLTKQAYFSDNLLDNTKFVMLKDILKIPLEEPIAVVVVGKIDGRVRNVDIITLSLSINTNLRDATGTLLPSFDMEIYGFKKNPSTNTLEAKEYGALIRFDKDKILQEHVGTANKLTEKTFTEILFEKLFKITYPDSSEGKKKLEEYKRYNFFYLFKINQNLGTGIVVTNLMRQVNQQNTITKSDIMINLLPFLIPEKNAVQILKQINSSTEEAGSFLTPEMIEKITVNKKILENFPKMHVKIIRADNLSKKTGGSNSKRRKTNKRRKTIKRRKTNKRRKTKRRKTKRRKTKRRKTKRRKY